MTPFKDISGRDWTLDLNDAALAEVKDTLRQVRGVEVTSLSKAAQLVIASGQGSDLFLLGMVLWRLLKNQAADRGITADDFARELGADGIVNGLRAFTDEMQNRGVASLTFGVVGVSGERS